MKFEIEIPDKAIEEYSEHFIKGTSVENIVYYELTSSFGVEYHPSIKVKRLA